jgi:hypothetical protein
MIFDRVYLVNLPTHGTKKKKISLILQLYVIFLKKNLRYRAPPRLFPLSVDCVLVKEKLICGDNESKFRKELISLDAEKR